MTNANTFNGMEYSEMTKKIYTKNCQLVDHFTLGEKSILIRKGHCLEIEHSGSHITSSTIHVLFVFNVFSDHSLFLTCTAPAEG